MKMAKMLSIYTISVHFLGPYIVDLLSEIRDKAAAKILLNRRTQSYHEQSETRICQEKFKKKENLETAKSEDLKTGNNLSKFNTKISKKPELVKIILNTVEKSISNRCPNSEINAVNHMSSLFSC